MMSFSYRIHDELSVVLVVLKDHYSVITSLTLLESMGPFVSIRYLINLFDHHRSSHFQFSCHNFHLYAIYRENNKKRVKFEENIPASSQLYLKFNTNVLI